MHVPIYLLLPGQRRVSDWEQPFRNDRCKYSIDECVGDEGSQDFVNMERKSCKAKIICERLDRLLQPKRIAQGEGVVHCSRFGDLLWGDCWEE